MSDKKVNLAEEPVVTDIEVSEEEVVEETKKKNFFISLFSIDGEISSKRFAGLFLIGIMGASGILSLFKELSDQALELNTTMGWMGLALLGVNVLPEIVKGFKK